MPALPGYEWIPSLHNYRSVETGRMVSRAAIRDGLEALMDTSAVNMNALTQSLIDGNISLASWQSSMMSEIKSAHVAASALANGGWSSMGPVEWGATGQMIREQYDYLRNFASQIADGTQPLDGRCLVRSDLYGSASNTTYSAMRTRLLTADGFEEEKRVLEDVIDACDDCIEYANEGWQPIGTLPEPGNDSVCLKRCRCEKVYRRVDDSGGWEESE